MKRVNRHILVLALVSSLFACKKSSESAYTSSQSPEREEVIAELDLDAIIARGHLTAIIDNSSTGLFLYKGEPMGYEFDLLTKFCKEIGVELRLEVTPGLSEGFMKLNQGKGDILAYNLTVTKERKERIAFTHYHNLVRQVLVQRKPNNWRDMKLHEIENTLIRNPIDLIGKEVWVRNSSSYLARMRNLSDEIGGDIIIVEDYPDVETEGLIKKVAEGQVEYTISDEDVALVNASYYPILDVKTPVSLPQQIAWGVRKNAPNLLNTLNGWIDRMRKTSDYYVIYDKYFRSTRQSRRRVQSEFFSSGDGRISPYDSLIREAAAKLNWDWRLLAAQINKESRFDPYTQSWAGAIGLMQILPKTGKRFGADNLRDPVQNIDAGSNYLVWLQDFWRPHVPDSLERVKFILGSYNVGQGHVMDAVRLAKKYEKDTAVWNDNVGFYLLQKSYSKFFNDPVVKHGYCRGIEPINYVSDILSLYENYLDIIPEQPEDQEVLLP
ncbi:MAG: transporter substrate-binding domain-containing protein [Bacteroidota bacterium]